MNFSGFSFFNETYWSICLISRCAHLERVPAKGFLIDIGDYFLEGMSQGVYI